MHLIISILYFLLSVSFLRGDFVTYDEPMSYTTSTLEFKLYPATPLPTTQLVLNINGNGFNQPKTTTLKIVFNKIKTVTYKIKKPNNLS